VTLLSEVINSDSHLANLLLNCDPTKTAGGKHCFTINYFHKDIPTDVDK